MKEFGEGVDRMCKELEAIGLPDPVFDNNTFILKTTIMSSSYQKLPIEDLKVADSVQNGNVEEQKLPIKLFRAAFLQACTNKNYNEPTIDNMKRVYDNLEVNQVFSSAYIKKILECSERTARNLITKIKETETIVPVTGKGMYRFKYATEYDKNS